MKNRRKIVKCLIIFLILIIADQVVKKIFINVNIEIIPNILSLKYLENTGVAFSMGKNIEVIIGINIIILIAILVAIVKFWNNNYIYSLIIVLSGGVGNLIDRIAHCYVIDYIKVLNFSTFNLADIFITVGIIVLIIQIFKKINLSVD